MLIGRQRELGQLDSLLREARLGRGRALVLRGSAGIGKTVLLDHAVQQASGFQVLHYTAVESEAELPFAGLQALLGPLLVGLPEIPEPQARAVRAALALESIAATNRLAVYAGALSLFGVAAERVPLLVVVDDAHWVDRPSAEAGEPADRSNGGVFSLVLVSAVSNGHIARGGRIVSGEPGLPNRRDRIALVRDENRLCLWISTENSCHDYRRVQLH
jgi:hypothetical protein